MRLFPRKVERFFIPFDKNKQHKRQNFSLSLCVLQLNHDYIISAVLFYSSLSETE